MMQFLQGTISGSGKRSAIDDIINKTDQTLFQETWGSSSFQRFFIPRKESDIISNALLSVDQLKSELMVSTAINILLSIQSTANAFRESKACPDILPQVRTVAPDDGSILIEWIFDNFRINFNIEEDYRQSSWHLISNNMGDVSASGYIQLEDIETINIWLFGFIILNYWR